MELHAQLPIGLANIRSRSVALHLQHIVGLGALVPLCKLGPLQKQPSHLRVNPLGKLGGGATAASAACASGRPAAAAAARSAGPRGDGRLGGAWGVRAVGGFQQVLPRRICALPPLAMVFLDLLAAWTAGLSDPVIARTAGAHVVLIALTDPGLVHHAAAGGEAPSAASRLGARFARQRLSASGHALPVLELLIRCLLPLASGRHSAGLGAGRRPNDRSLVIDDAQSPVVRQLEQRLRARIDVERFQVGRRPFLPELGEVEALGGMALRCRRVRLGLHVHLDPSAASDRGLQPPLHGVPIRYIVRGREAEAIWVQGLGDSDG
mmetsp:Transcript_49551/g.142055  ORF Transcript_49551/g.142055 Transcript_49551/m.142055 type:complete len:322 (+) Transcript_49551:1258-2223(+)